MNAKTKWVLATACVMAAACNSQPAASGPPAVACASSLATSIGLAVGADTQVSALADAGCLAFAANPGVDSVAYLIVPQATSDMPGNSFAFALQGGSAAPAAVAALAARRAQRSPSARLRQMGSVPLRFSRNLHRRRVASASRVRAALRRAPVRASVAPVTPPAVGSTRTFSVCADYNCDTYQSVGARVQSVGAHIAVYVDTTAPSNGLDSAQVDTLRALFDTLYTIDTVAFGGISDIDTNGVVLMLMTPVVNHLVTAAECYSGGYVAGFFNPIDFTDTTVSNKGEIFYTIVADPNGIYSCYHYASDVEAALPTTFLHELQHVISFNQHVLVRGGAEEDLWLDEALSSFAEELGGRHYLPDTVAYLNYVAYAASDAFSYLQDPPDGFLLQESDTVLADFGAGWLYIRYLVDQFGPGLTLKLEETTQTGTGNIAAQTGVPFATTAGRWALANYVSDLPNFSPPTTLRYLSWPLRPLFVSLSAWDPIDFPPSPFPLVPTTEPGPNVSVSGVLDAGSGAYVQALQGALAPGYSMFLGANATTAIAPASGPLLNIIRIR